MEKEEKDIIKRKKVVLAMELLCRCINDEIVEIGWLMGGVADGDIPRYSIDVADVDDYYVEDGNFKDLMSCFLRRMYGAYLSGGLYADGIVSDSKEDEEE